MTASTLKSRVLRASTALAVAALLSAPAALLAPARATAPEGSLAEVILETRDATGQPWNASLEGWWGHEGGKGDTGKRPTFLSMDLSDGNGVVDDATTAAVHQALQDGGDFGSLRVAFVPYSADGSNERPKVRTGENAGEAFRWFADLGVGSALNGTMNPNDAVSWVSTLDEYTKWWRAGRPVQGFTNQLEVLDIADHGNTRPSPTPEGKSILDRWPAGSKISLVFYVSDGVDKAMPQIPTVKVGPDGRALTSWLTFQTVVSPTNPVRTSGGYRVLTGAGTGPEAARPVKTGTGQDGAAPAGKATGVPAGANASPASSTPADAKASDAGGTAADRLVSSLPGGRPTFWVVLALLVVGAGGLTTMRLRSSGAGPDAGSRTADVDRTVSARDDRAPL